MRFTPSVVAVDIRVDAEVAGGGRGGVAAVAVVVTRREERAGGDVERAEALDEEAGADQLVVAVVGGEAGPGLAGAVPGVGHLVVGGTRVAVGRIVGEARVAGLDARVDDADDHAFARALRAAEAVPQALREVEIGGAVGVGRVVERRVVGVRARELPKFGLGHARHLGRLAQLGDLCAGQAGGEAGEGGPVGVGDARLCAAQAGERGALAAVEVGAVGARGR